VRARPVPPATDDPVIVELERLRREAEAFERCLLSGTRTRVVFGEGDPHSDLMFVGEAPGYHEDQQGRPFVGQAGKLLEQLLGTIDLTRERVYIANVLKSRPPNNRDPKPEEIDACQPYLLRQIQLIAPRVICTLGNFSTKLLSGSQTGITRVHGIPQRTRIAGRELYLYPIFHPAAALYTPAMLATLKQDFLRLPEVLGLPLGDDEDAAALAAEAGERGVRDAFGEALAPPQRSFADAADIEPGAGRAPLPPATGGGRPAEQLGLF
jgi:uracil-DNA glycosylase family 4